MSASVETPAIVATVPPPPEIGVAQGALGSLRLLSVPVLLLLGFLVASYANTLYPFLSMLGLPERIGVYTLAAYLLLLGGAVLSLEWTQKCPVPLWKGYLTVFLVALLLMGAAGLARGNQFRLFAFDGIAYGVVLAGFILGRRDEVWQLLRWPVAVLSALGVFIAIRFTDSMVLTDRSILTQEAGSFAESVLVLATLFLIVANARYDRRYFFFMAAVAVGVLFVHLYFARRSMSVRTLVEIVTGTIILPFVFFRRRFLSTLAAGGLVAVIIGLLMYFPFDTLIQRYTKTYGVVDTLTTGNERWLELAMMFEELSASEVLVGRGLGGTFLEGSFYEEFASDDENGGRATTHLGFGGPILKGGVIWWGVYFYPLLYIVRMLPRIRRFDPLSICVAAAGCILLAIQGIEGTVTYSAAWVGLGLGMVGGRAQNISWQRRQETG